MPKKTVKKKPVVRKARKTVRKKTAKKKAVKKKAKKTARGSGAVKTVKRKAKKAVGKKAKKATRKVKKIVKKAKKAVKKKTKKVVKKAVRKTKKTVKKTRKVVKKAKKVAKKPRKVLKKKAKRVKREKRGTWKDRIRRSLTEASTALSIPATPRVVRNRDGSVDGELRLPIQRGVQERDVIKRISQAVDNGSFYPPPGSWLSMGARYNPDVISSAKGADDYRVWWGKVDVGAPYQRARFSAENLGTALRYADAMRKRYRRKASEVTIRIHYNPRDRRPTQKGKKGKVR